MATSGRVILLRCSKTRALNRHRLTSIKTLLDHSRTCESRHNERAPLSAFCSSKCLHQFLRSAGLGDVSIGLWRRTGMTCSVCDEHYTTLRAILTEEFGDVVCLFAR